MSHVKPSPEPSPRRLVPALVRGMAILEGVAAAREPKTGAELSRMTGVPRTTVHDLSQTLVELGYLRVADSKLHSYALGTRLLSLANAYTDGFDLARAAGPVVDRLRDVAKETVQVAILDGSDVLYIAKAESLSVVRLVSEVGRRLPAHVTAVGKILLSHLDSRALGTLFAGVEELPTMTACSVRSVSQLVAILPIIRAQGWAEDYCESNPDVACVAVPITDQAGQYVAGLSVSVPVHRWSQNYRDHLTTQLRAAAAELVMPQSRRETPPASDEAV